MRDEDDRLVVPDEAAELMVEAAKAILEAFMMGGPEEVPPHAIALAHMVEDYLA